MARPEIVAERKEGGGRQISASLTKDEVALLERVKRKGGHATNKAAILAALSLADEGELTDDALAALVLQRMKRGKGRGGR